MHAELRQIEPNDFFADWEEFASVERSDPWDDFGSFTLSIGPVGDPGSELFQVLVATHAAASRAKGNRGHFRGIIVDSFEPLELAKSLRRFVADIAGHTWIDIVEQLRLNMDWEYDGMGGT